MNAAKLAQETISYIKRCRAAPLNAPARISAALCDANIYLLEAEIYMKTKVTAALKSVERRAHYISRWQNSCDIIM